MGILVAIILFAGLGVTAVNNIQQSSQTLPSPTPTPEPVLFNEGQRNNVQGMQTTQSSKEERVQATFTMEPTKKQIKQYAQSPRVLAEAELEDKKVVIETNKGKIEFEIFPDAPKAASNFIFLTRDGFYNGLTFHRVEPNFVIQGGDPLGNGTGGPGYKFEDEPVTKRYDRGIVAMANAGPNTNGSQFFIMLADMPLPPQYTIFGKVISGQEVVDQIRVGDVMNKVSITPLSSNP